MQKMSGTVARAGSMLQGGASRDAPARRLSVNRKADASQKALPLLSPLSAGHLGTDTVPYKGKDGKEWCSKDIAALILKEVKKSIEQQGRRCYNGHWREVSSHLFVA